MLTVKRYINMKHCVNSSSSTAQIPFWPLQSYREENIMLTVKHYINSSCSTEYNAGGVGIAQWLEH